MLAVKGGRDRAGVGCQGTGNNPHLRTYYSADLVVQAVTLAEITLAPVPLIQTPSLPTPGSKQ
jgi:hypothetical protein